MTNGEIVRETALWMEGRWTEDLSVSALAAKAGYSQHHFGRLFAGVFGVPPKEYVLRRRLSEAARALAAGGSRVTDVAFDFGFNDLETFTRAFRRSFGTTPTAVRRGAPFAYFGGATAAYAAAGGLPALSAAPTLESFPRFLIAGYAVTLGEDPSAVGRAWGRFAPRAAAVPRAAKPATFRQLAYSPDDEEDRTEIIVGIEMETLDDLPFDLVAKVIPACDCLVFEHRGPVARLGESYRAIYAELLPSLNRKPGPPFNFEAYYPDAGDPWGDTYRCKICVPLV